jgi:chorismate mutase/prephenate dehydratase
MTSRTKLEELTGHLAEVDRDILRAVERRARIVQDLVKVRGDASRYAPVTDPARIKALEEAASPPLSAAAVRGIFAALDAGCRMFEVAPKVACVGTEGAFTFLAAALHFGPRAELLRADTPEKALEEVARSRADFATVPYESMKEGLAFATIQAIAAHDLKLVGEREMVHVLDLVSRSGTAAEVDKIYVSPHHHVLCEGFLEASFPKAAVHDVRSAQMAWELALENHGAAAIVPAGFGSGELRAVKENVADEGALVMRYGIVSRIPVPRTGNDATALLFSVNDRPGALHDLLENFKERNCNLRRIQSRTIPGEGWEYVFYVEVTGHMTDRNLVAALEGVKKKARMLKIIGSFPLDVAEPPPSSEGQH